MSNEPQARETDLVLDPFQYAYILDTTKGNISALVGPNKTSLSTTDQPVRFGAKERRFENVRRDDAVLQFPSAPEGWYMVLENPVLDGKEHPAAGASNTNPELAFGRKVNMPGPLMFPLWPGQVAEVIEGHNMRSNQYLVVRIYDEEAAKENWGKAVVKRATPKTDGEGGEKGDEDEAPETSPSVLPEAQAAPDLTIGQLLVIKGTDVSFYIPPTGVEVLPGEEGKFVRHAITLERLQYCVLLDESGTKRYVRGPAVVFPEATEAFLTESGGKIYASDTKVGKSSVKGARKFRAIELNENSGLYLKVIDGYEEDGQSFKEGQELFITGADVPIYFPREEHSIIKYGDEQVHFAVAIPDGEARYVLNRLTGQITLIKGPKMFLADPRTQVVIRRVLSENLVRLLYPGNEEAVEHNKELEEMTSGEASESFVYDRTARRRDRAKRLVGSVRSQVYSSAIQTSGLMPQSLDEETGDAHMPDDFERRSSFTPPRTITLETKYDGAVAVNVWTGYAILTVNKRGGRQVHIGPCNVLLDYDEAVEVLELSTGMPKATDQLKRTVYLRVSNNTVSDRVDAETKDLVDVSVGVSYRVDFESDEHEKWFAVENYVKFLTEHLRSMIRGAVKKMGVEEFNDHATEIIRDTILGKAGEGGKRAGRAFPENSMRVYDVEVLNVQIGNEQISRLLVQTQHASVSSALTIRQRERDLEITKRSAVIEREEQEAIQQTAIRINELATEAIASKLEKDLAEIDSRHQATAEGLTSRLAEQEDLDKIQDSELGRQQKKEDQRLAIEKTEADERLVWEKAETDNLVARAEAIGPSFVSALNSLGDKEFAARVTKEIAPLAVLRGGSIADSLTDLVQNLPEAAATIQGIFKNGNGHPTPASAETTGSGD